MRGSRGISNPPMQVGIVQLRKLSDSDRYKDLSKSLSSYFETVSQKKIGRVFSQHWAFPEGLELLVPFMRILEANNINRSKCIRFYQAFYHDGKSTLH